MNKKSLLIALFATAFSGMNVTASETPLTVDTLVVKTVKTFKGVTDKAIRRHCRESNSELCQDLAKLMAATDSLDADAINAQILEIRKEIAGGKTLDAIEGITEVVADTFDKIGEALNK